MPSLQSRSATLLPAQTIIDLIPGIALAAVVAMVAYLGSQLFALILAVPAMVLALLIGIPLNPIASGPIFRPGISFCVRVILRCAVALLGLRIALSDITSLGFKVALLVVAALSLTVVSGFLIARWTRQPPGFGALAGVATAICGASATLAVSAVVPHYPDKQRDVVFIVIAVNALSTFAMVAYPAFCSFLGLDAQMTGVLLGATIHDVAQVVGAGYSVSEETGNTAVIVKLFRVFLLLPVVLAVGWYLSRNAAEQSEARVPVPVFAIMFLVLCALNSVAPQIPGFMPLFQPLKHALSQLSTWGLLIAIAALGLDTSIKAVAQLNWKHFVTMLGTTMVIFTIVAAGLLLF